MRAYEKLVEFWKTTVRPNVNKDFVTKKNQGNDFSFRKEFQKINETKRSGSSEEALYKRNLWYFEFSLLTRRPARTN